MVNRVIQFFLNLKLIYIILSGVTFGIFLPVFISWTILIGIETELKTKELIKLGEDIQSTLEVGLGGHLWDLRQDLAGELVEAVCVNRSVADIKVYDYLSKQVFVSCSNVSPDGTNLVYFKKEIVYNGKPLGILKINMSDYYVMENLQSNKKRLFYIFVSQLLFTTLFILILLYWKILRPLKKLNAQANSFANNDLTSNYEWRIKDEIGLVGNNFENARCKLLEADKLKKDYNMRLDNEVVKKTEELRELNDTLELRVHQEVEKNKIQNIIVQHNARLAALGEMVQNIAHQWRQPLNGISVRASGFKLKHNLGILGEEDIDETMDGIVQTTQFLSDTIDDFRNFLNQTTIKTDFIVSDVINDIYSIARYGFEIHDINVYFDLDETIVLNGLRGELSQVILNILNNAKDIFIENDIRNRIILINLKKLPNDILITIQDNGGGIPSEIIGKIFNPYFTTKEKNDGTGIGLYMCAQIVQDHFMGELLAQNMSFIYNENEEYGAVFVIKIPLTF